MAHLEIFRAGRFTALGGKEFDFSEADVAGIAASYDPGRHEAPMVVGHPKVDAPAYGWVRRLRFENGKLLAEPGRVDPQFAEMVNAGRFKNVSASLYPPGHPKNPAKDRWYLRHLGFLGAHPPAVAGLKPASFAEDDAAVTIEFGAGDARNEALIARMFRSIREWILGTAGSEAADKAVPPWEISELERDAVVQEVAATPGAAAVGFGESERKEDGMDPKELAAREQAVVAKEASFAERETGLTTRETDLTRREAEVGERENRLRAEKTGARRAEFVAFADGLVNGGRLPAKQKAAIVETLVALDAAATVEFGEGDQKQAVAPVELLRGVLSAMPKLVEFGEFAGGDGPEFAADDAAVARKAQEYKESERRAGREISTTEAVKHVKGGNR